MPEIKNSFLKGKMNKDLDERLVPNGEYRDALNIEVSTSEGSNVGVVKNILGNHRLEDIIPDGFTCVGSFADEKTNKIYWFVSSYDTNAIIEFNVDLYDVSKSNPDKPWLALVIVDKYVGTSRAVLKFTGQIITGISVIDNLLLWTDNINDPRKINIDECKKGTVDLNTHTQLIFDKGSFNGMTIDLITNTTLNPFIPINEGERVWYNIKQLDALLGVDAIPGGYTSSLAAGLDHRVKHYRDNEYLGVKKIIVFDNLTPSSEEGTYFHAIDESDIVITNAWEKGDVIFGNDVTIDIEERHVTVIKLKPLNAPSVKINHSEDVNSISSIPNLFETKLPRFSYRYKYRDGEFSPFAPFTHPVFNAKYPKDTSVSNDTNIFYNKDNAYAVEEPYNKAMINSIHSIELTDFVTPNMPEDVTEIEILYKQEESPIIYSIKTIKHSHKDWHASGNYEGKGLNIGLGKSEETTNGTYRAQGGLTKGKYTITTENIYAALPANQLLRPWDNVPKKALAQEVTGNRIVYGNYVQNYDLGEDTEVSVSYSDRKTNIGSFETRGLQHVKSQRNYQVGVVYSDKYGRETPVLTSTDGAVNIPWKGNNGNTNASRSLQLSASVANNFPEWVDSLKFFIKETSNPYYNLVMDRAWVTKSTYELDDSKGNIWISFPSSDRNKVSEEDYIILKKKIGTGEEQISTENKFKIIDIQNNAPDAIKYQLVNYGQLNQSNQTQGTNSLTLDIFTSADQRIDKEVDTIKMDIDGWKDFTNSGSALFGGVPIEDNVDQLAGPIRTSGLYISWRRLDVDGKGVSSKKYKITNGKIGSDNYTFKLATKITKIDADIAHYDGNSATTTTTLDSEATPALHPDLIVQIERKERKDGENFSGKFFVKISKNQVTDLIDNGNPVNVLDQFQVTSKTASWYWQDDIGTSATVDNADSGNDYGLTNYNGHLGDHTTDPEDSIQHSDNNDTVGDFSADSATSGSLKVTDWHSPWEGILTTFKPTFFIDSMHMAAGQSEASNYAKYSCVTWSGCTSGESDSAEDSSWSYPPLKTWITDFEDQAGLKKKVKANSVWFNDDLISTSPLVDPQDDWRNKRIDGWVGPLQRPKRDTPTDAGAINANHINGLEGIVTTVDDHAVGPRRWFSGMTSDNTEHGVGNDTKVYSNDGEIGRHFMHLSFFAPGKDLHTGTFKDADPTLFGSDSWAANLQGIWGGGVFGGGSKNKKFGDTEDHRHIMMEGNHDSNNNYRYLSPRPGVGAGYDLKYKELHARQWDPTFNEEGDEDNKIRDFIRNLHPGARFRFNKVSSGSADTVVYTIKKVSVKKLYNHTSWRKAYNRYSDADGYTQPFTEHEDYKSVEQTALDYLDKVKTDGTTADTDTRDQLMAKIKQFGAAHNRRLCYIIELDKSPTDSTTNGGFNPLDASENIMSADFAGNNFCDIEFLDPVKSVLLSDLSKFPAIWELDPKKQEVDLDIYYEASNNLPVKINDRTNELFAPIGCRIEVLNSTITSASILQSWDNSTATFYPGFPKYDDENVEINYSGLSFKFIREDGGYTVAEVEEYESSAAIITEFKFKENIGENIVSGLSWYNSFSFGNGIESNRIKDDFNAIYISNGVKASTTTQEIYEEEHKAHSLIYSGIYNSNSSINDLNQFIMAEKTTKDLNPTFGSIQKLFQRRISLIAFCEDKVISIVSNKDTIYNADGNPQLIASNMVLGDANPFSGNYGISKNPESFARESFRTYFTDKQRGAVLRLSKDGLTPISKAGMHDWFRDNLTEYNSLIGTYDSYKEDYNLTLSNNSFSQNLLQDSYIEAGGDPISIDPLNRITDGAVNSGTAFQYLYEIYDVLDVNDNLSTFNWDDFTTASYALTASANIIHHEEIPFEQFQVAIPHVPSGDQLEILASYSTTLTTSNGSIAGEVWGFTNDGYTISNEAVPWQADFVESSSSSPWSNWFNDSNFGNTLEYNQFNPNISCQIDRHMPDAVVDSPSDTGWNNIEYSELLTGTSGWYADVQILDNASNIIVMHHGTQSPESSGAGSGVTGSLEGAIAFVRAKSDNYIDFFNFGAVSGTGHSSEKPAFNFEGGDLNDDYDAIINGTQYNVSNNITTTTNHGALFNGDELHIEVEFVALATHAAAGWSASGANNAKEPYGWNHIQPQFEIIDSGGAVLTSSNFVTDLYTKAEIEAGVMGDWDNDGNHRMSDADDVTPWNCFHSDPFTAGTATEGQLLYDQVNTFDDEWWQAMGWHNSPVATHATTNSQTNYEGFFHQSVGGTSQVGNNENARSIWCSASFKIQDTDPANNSSLYTIDSGHLTGTIQHNTIEVINNLKLRVQQVEPDLSGAALTATWMGTANSNLVKPVWFIRSIKIRKGFGITSPYVAPFVGPPAVLGVASSPPHTIPAWTEITHNYFAQPTLTWNTINNAAWSGTPGEENTTYIHIETQDVYGSNRGAIYQTDYAANQGDPTQQGAVINYKTPEGFNMTNGLDEFVTNGGVIGDSIGVFNGGTGSSYSRITETTTGDPFVTHNNDYIYIENYDADSASDITHDITNNPWTVDEWYLVDVEYDDFTPGTDPGEILVYGAAPLGGFVNGGEIHSAGIGLYSGDDPTTPTIAHCTLVPVNRNEYGGSGGSGDNKPVLRGIFKISNDSWVSDPLHKDTFTLRVLGCTNGIKITKIITKNLSQTITGGGSTVYWDSPVSSAVHSFSDNTTFFKSNKLCWDISANAGGINLFYTWSQDLVNTNTLHQGPWDLLFTVSDNPTTNNHSGSLGGILAVNDLSTGTQFRGVEFGGIEDIGEYKISFDLTDNSDGSGWVVYKKDGDNWIAYTNQNFGTAAASNTWTIGNAGNKLQFYSDLYQTNAQEYAINDISLVPLEQTILIGDIGSWNINGFDIHQVNPYIYLDNAENYFAFYNCPIQDNGHEFISISQQVGEITSEFDKYKISFNHGITTGEIGIYYYNNSGYGFKITGIDYSTPTSFEQVITIGDPPILGDGLWSPGQDGNIQNGVDYGPSDLDFDSDLKNTFVIVARDNGDINGINGWIDNISMVRVYTDETTADKTITFNEAVNGWSSFKSFVPENGVSISKKYFTFKNGRLFQHYIPKLQGSTGDFDIATGFYIKTTAEQADNYNEFYGVNNYSSIQAVVNPEPSTVKVFNTINYEGSQAYVYKPNTDEITISNAAALGGDILGWECSEIKTNLDSGSIIEFIEKEGKWFNYIKGLGVNQALDTSRFSVQGIGIVSSTQSID